MSVTINGNIGAVYQPDVLTVGNIVDADQTVTNSATLVTVPQLTFPIGTNERVLFRYTIFYTSTASGDLKYRVDVPASPTLYRLATDNTASDLTAGVTSVITAEADSTALLASGTDGVLRLTGVLSNGTTAGQVLFQFAQNTATGSQSAIIRAGSFFEYRNF
jgi:hypothetical protein